MFKKILQFCQISLKILPYLTDLSPQLMACMLVLTFGKVHFITSYDVSDNLLNEW